MACYESLPPDMEQSVTEQGTSFHETSSSGLISSPNCGATIQTEMLRNPPAPSNPSGQGPLDHHDTTLLNTPQESFGMSYGGSQQESESAEFSLVRKSSDYYISL